MREIIPLRLAVNRHAPDPFEKYQDLIEEENP